MDGELKETAAVHFYRAMFSTVPEDRYRVCGSRELFYRLVVKEG